MRLGSPANPNVLLPGQTSGPILGGTWDPIIDHTTFATGATLDFLATQADGMAINVPTGVGTLLCNVPLSADFLFFETPGTAFSVPIPDACQFAGRSVICQGGSLGGPGGLQLTNALDIVLGHL